MATIGYMLLIVGVSILGLGALGFMVWNLAWIIEAVREKEFGDVIVPFTFLGIIIFIAGIVLIAISEGKQKQQIKEPVVINAAQQETK